MRFKLSRVISLVWFMPALLLAAGTVLRVTAADEVKLQALLVWATDDPKPPEGKDYKPLETRVRKRLAALKWKNYFAVKKIGFSATAGVPKKVALSDKCELDIKLSGNSNIEVTLIGKGKEVARQKQALPEGEILVLGGNAPNGTAWLVILRHAE